MVEIQNIFIAIVLFSMVSIGIFSFANDLIGNYASEGVAPIEGNYSEVYQSFDVLQDLNNSARGIYDNLQGGDNDKADKLQFFILAPALVWNVVTTILKLPFTILDITALMFNTIGLPDWIFTGFTIILIVIFGFLIL